MSTEIITAIATIIVTAISAGAAVASSRSARKASQATAREESEREAYVRAKDFYVGALGQSEKVIAELRGRLGSLEDKVDEQEDEIEALRIDNRNKAIKIDDLEREVMRLKRGTNNG